MSKTKIPPEPKKMTKIPNITNIHPKRSKMIKISVEPQK